MPNTKEVNQKKGLNNKIDKEIYELFIDKLGSFFEKTAKNENKDNSLYQRSA